ncbi:MAG: SAM-dependent methyltransferase, partial [Pseudomonadota bacterium]
MKIRVGLPHALLLFSTSASVLAYEILLMRLLSIGFWHHFAYMVISLALLGFGAAGSLLFLAFERIRRHLEDWLVIAAGATAVSFSLAFSLSQKVGLDPLQLVWQNTEWLKMLSTYLLMAVPFLMAGLIVGMILTAAGERAHLMYAADLTGAAFGALAIVPALYLGPPWVLLPALGFMVLAGAALYTIRLERRVTGALSILLSSGLLVASYLLFPPIPRIHHTKALPMALSFPDARIEAERTGPLGMIHVVGSSLIREVPGLSLNFGIEAEPKEASLPHQKGVFVDGDALGPITRFRGDPDELKYLDFTSQALPYHIRHPENVLVMGAGGGTDVLLGLRHRISKIVALEANRQVADILKGPFAHFSGDLYSRPEVRLELREARQYLHATRERFDLIQLSLLDSFASSAGGLHSASESYLYTTEAFRLYLSRLSERGVLAVTRWLKLPPRDSLRLFATAMDVLAEMQLFDRPDRHILFIRSWKTATILISRSPFNPEEIANAVHFCDQRSFDLAYYADMKPEMANRYDILEAPFYFDGARALSGPKAKDFLKGYVFDVSPTTDDRPYFSHFFRWDKAFTLFQHLRREWFPLIDLGYVFVVATLVQAVVAGAGLILLPLVFIRWVRGRPDPDRAAVPRKRDILGILIYFGSIGLGFMFLEMAFLPKFTL